MPTKTAPTPWVRNRNLVTFLSLNLNWGHFLGSYRVLIKRKSVFKTNRFFQWLIRHLNRNYNIRERHESFSNKTPVKLMTKQKFYSPLKIGLLIVAVAYFLFTFHGMFTLSWIGEWESLGGGGSLFSTIIFVEDISASIGLVFRLIASTAAFAGIILYFVKKDLSAQTTMKVLRVVLVGEAIYWLGLLVSGVLPLVYLRGFGDGSILTVLTSLLTSEIPLLVESIAIPVALFKLAYELNPNKTAKGAIKWGLIAGTVYVLVFWLVNTGLWIATIQTKGMEYLTTHPENLFSFAITTIGMLALTVYTAYFANKSIGTETLEKLNLTTVGAIIIALGLFFLWNYMTWIFFGRNEIWSTWYAWFLGHNMDLWLLSIPLVGLPLLFARKASD